MHMMRGTDRITPHFLEFFKTLSPYFLLSRHSQTASILMKAYASQFYGITIYIKAFIRNDSHITQTDGKHCCIGNGAVVFRTYLQLIQTGIFRRPEEGLLQTELQSSLPAFRRYMFPCILYFSLL